MSAAVMSVEQGFCTFTSATMKGAFSGVCGVSSSDLFYLEIIYDIYDLHVHLALKQAKFNSISTTFPLWHFLITP